MTMKILLVEDEDSIREVQKAYLERAGYTVIESPNGLDAIEKFKEDEFDLILLDLNLPEVDGIQVCRRIRLKSEVPIIMVTARDSEMDEISGFELGADDYIKKPFSPSVLVSRVNALLKRSSNKKILVGDISIDPERMEILKKEKVLEMTTTQFNIIYTLAKLPGKVFTREELLKLAYDNVLFKETSDRTIDAHIKNIRKLVETDHKKPKYILTIIGKGYKFNDKV